jgi:DNA-directed RNA polymerase subunit M/transcription elongation factor TFIIS
VVTCWRVPQEIRTVSWYATAAVQRIKVCRNVSPNLYRRISLIAVHLDTASKTITTTTKPASFPSLLRQKRSMLQTVEKSDFENQAMSKTDCPECGAKEVRFSAVQLRSADEGSTIFYHCKCGNR